MTQISYLVGDATAPQIPGPKIIVHVCNDIGAWGKGFVKAHSNRWSETESQYKGWYNERERNDFGLNYEIL